MASTSPINNKYPWLLFVCWLIWSGVHFTMLYNWNFHLIVALNDAITTNILLLLISIMAANNQRYYRPQKGKYIYILGFCLAISGVFILLVKFILGSLFGSNTTYYTFLQNSLPVRFNIAFLVTGCMTMIGELWYSVKEHQENESRKADAEKLAKDAELYKLRQQLQPHFLFNSLNSISALVGSRPEQARNMIQQLSDFLRGTLKKEENFSISLGEELNHLQLYLDIEKVRFGHRLNTSITCDEMTAQKHLPHMLLQPLVENAIKFGLYDTTEPVAITIQASSDEYYLYITVQNPFDPETSYPKQGTGFGLSSVQRRLYLLYARHDLLKTSAENNLYITTLKIPQEQ